MGQNLGAGRPRRAEASVWLTARYNLYFLGAVSVIFLLAPGLLVERFTSDSEVAAMGVRTLRFLGSCYVVYAYGLVVVQAFNGAGDTRTPTLLNFLCFWLWQIPVAWLLAHPLGMGPSGPLLAAATAETLMGLLGMMLFRRGWWRLTRV